MTELKREAIALIAKLPAENKDVLVNIVKTLRNVLNKDFQDEIYSRAEEDLAIMEDIETLTREEGNAKDG